MSGCTFRGARDGKFEKRTDCTARVAWLHADARSVRHVEKSEGEIFAAKDCCDAARVECSTKAKCGVGRACLKVKPNECSGSPTQWVAREFRPDLIEVLSGKESRGFSRSVKPSDFASSREIAFSKG